MTRKKVQMIIRHTRFVSVIICLALCSIGMIAPPLAQDKLQPAAPPAEIQTLTNATVIDMVIAGLSDDIILEKLRRSPVEFDVSTDGLISLKKASVSDQVVQGMLARPKGPPVLEPRADTGQAQTTNQVVTPFGQIATILVKSPTEVLRTNAEKVIARRGGPRVNSSEIGYDAIMVIGIDCGKQRWSLWTGASFTTCEGSLTIESGGERLWSTTDHERAANESKAGRKMVGRMTSAFVKAWKAAEKHSS